MVALWIVVGVIGAALLYLIVAYNRFVRLRTRIEAAWSQIDVQLRRRYDLIPNLISTVKGYASHEKTIFEEVARARNAAIGATGLQGKADAENQITGALRQLFAVVENYPDLKANQNFLGLQEELSGTEGRIAYARQFYNDTVQTYNTKVQQFPSSIVAAIGKFNEREFFQTEDATRAAVQVKF